MAQNVLNANTHVAGTLSATRVNLPDGTVTNASVLAGAGIAATKLEHQFPVRYQTVAGTAVATATHPIHIAHGATGDLVALRVACTTAPTTSDTVTVDLQKSTAGGAFASVLTGVVTLNSSSTARVVQSGTISSAPFVTTDIFQVVVVASGTSCQGLVVVAVLREDAA